MMIQHFITIKFHSNDSFGKMKQKLELVKERNYVRVPLSSCFVVDNYAIDFGVEFASKSKPGTRSRILS